MMLPTVSNLASKAEQIIKFFRNFGKFKSAYELDFWTQSAQYKSTLLSQFKLGLDFEIVS